MGLELDKAAMCVPTDDVVAVLAAPSTSPWLRSALESALSRDDPISAASDAAELARLLAGEVETMIFLDEWRSPSTDVIARADCCSGQSSHSMGDDSAGRGRIWGNQGSARQGDFGVKTRQCSDS